MNRLAAYKVKHGDCHFQQDYKDDTELATWVNNVRQRHTKLTEKQEQTLAALGFAWNIKEINESKRQQMVLEVRLIVNLLSLSHNFANNLLHSGK